MSAHEEIEKIKAISGSEPRKVDLSGSAAEEAGPSKVKFDEAVAHADPSKVERRELSAAQESLIAEAKKPTIMDIATQASPASSKVTPTPKQLASQAADLQRQISRPRAVLLDTLETQPAVAANLNPNDVSALSGHLEHVDRELRDITQLTTGVEVGSVVPKEKSAAERFLSYLTESDKKLGTIVDEVNGLQQTPQKVTPSTLLAIQVKLGFVQTEMEFFTATLNKALESTKTLMNVQI